MLTDLIKQLRTGEITSAALTEAALTRIAERSHLNSYITVCADTALEAARAADLRLRAGDAPPLCGIPFSLKDNIVTAGIRTTCASRMLENFVPPYDAFVWERLRAQGAVLLGKTNLDEFAMGGGGETSAFGACLNPHDLCRAAGGSSGGSAAAVADGQGFYSLGSDTGGSVRVPAAYCGVVGVKPTYGRISRRGLIAFASSLDQIGVLALSAADSAVVLAAICGADPMDMTSAERPVDFADVRGCAAGMRVGFCPALLEQCSPAAARLYRESAEMLRAGGAEIAELTLPDADTAYAAYYLISACEASSNLARYDGIRYGSAASAPRTIADTFTGSRAAFGAEVKRRLLSGTAALSAEERVAAYDRARRTRAVLTEQMNALFAQCGVILTPTVPDVAYPVGTRSEEAIAYRSCDAFTTLPSLAGLPAISIPAGKDGALPLGMQIIAPAFREDLMYRAALALEEAIGYGK